MNPINRNNVSTLVQLSRLRVRSFFLSNIFHVIAFQQWSIIFGLAISSFDDVLLAVAICRLLSLRQTAFEE